MQPVILRNCLAVNELLYKKKEKGTRDNLTLMILCVLNLDIKFIENIFISIRSHFVSIYITVFILINFIAHIIAQLQRLFNKRYLTYNNLILQYPYVVI